MKAFALETLDKPASLIQLPKPEIGADGTRVTVRAASVNGIDVFQAGGYLAAMMAHALPTVIGRDFAGVVEAVGSDVDGLAAGDAVFGFIPATLPLKSGAFAEYVAGGPELVVAAKPAQLEFNTAAALPLAGSAALDLLEAIEGREGQVVLVVGATGGVGSLVVQLAARDGLTVIATARAAEDAFVRGFGAAETIDYSSGSVGDAVRSRYPDGIDALIDLIDQKDGLTELASVVRSGGHVATLMNAADIEALAARGVTGHNVNAAPTVAKLRLLAGLAATGAIRVPIQAVYPIEQAADAIQAFQGGTRGKLIVSV